MVSLVQEGSGMVETLLVQEPVLFLVPVLLGAGAGGAGVVRVTCAGCCMLAQQEEPVLLMHVGGVGAAERLRDAGGVGGCQLG